MEAKGECNGEKKEFERECAASWVSSFACLLTGLMRARRVDRASSTPRVGTLADG